MQERKGARDRDPRICVLQWERKWIGSRPRLLYSIEIEYKQSPTERRIVGVDSAARTSLSRNIGTDSIVSYQQFGECDLGMDDDTRLAGGGTVVAAKEGKGAVILRRRINHSLSNAALSNANFIARGLYASNAIVTGYCACTRALSATGNRP